MAQVKCHSNLYRQYSAHFQIYWSNKSIYCTLTHIQNTYPFAGFKILDETKFMFWFFACLLSFLCFFLSFFPSFLPFSPFLNWEKNCHTKLIGYSVPFKESKITIKWRICITRVFSYVIYIIDKTAEIYTSIFIWVDCIPCVSMIFTCCSKKKRINKKNTYEVEKRGEVYQIWKFCKTSALKKGSFSCFVFCANEIQTIPITLKFIQLLFCFSVSHSDAKKKITLETKEASTKRRLKKIKNQKRIYLY